MSPGRGASSLFRDPRLFVSAVRRVIDRRGRCVAVRLLAAEIWSTCCAALVTFRFEPLDRQGEDIADAAFGRDDRRRIRTSLQFASQPQDLHIEASIEDVLMDACCLQEMLAGQRTQRSVEKGHQQGVFAPGQCDRASVGAGKAPAAPINLAPRN